MPRHKIDATLDLLTAEKLAEAHRFVEVWERAGYMNCAEAAAWRERIAIWRRFGVGEQRPSPRPVADIPLVDDADPFL